MGTFSTKKQKTKKTKKQKNKKANFNCTFREVQKLVDEKAALKEQLGWTYPQQYRYKKE
jgi:hypothetical protein